MTRSRTDTLLPLFDERPRPLPPPSVVVVRTPEQRERDFQAILDQLAICETGGARMSEIASDWYKDVQVLIGRGYDITLKLIGDGWLVKLKPKIETTDDTNGDFNAKVAEVAEIWLLRNLK